MVRRFTPLLLAALALSVANPLSAAPPAPPKPQDQPRLPAAKAPARPVGVWVRDVGPLKLVLKFTDDRLTATAIYALNEEVCPVLRVTFDADYAVAKDGTLFGVIFGTDANHPLYATTCQSIDGQPFAFGWRVDGENLTVRNLKYVGEGMRTQRDGELANLRMLVAGRYTRIDESKLSAWEKKFGDAGFQEITALIDAQLEEYRPKPPVPPPFSGTSRVPTAPPSNPAPSTPPLFRHVPGKCEAPTAMTPAPVPALQPPPTPTPDIPNPLVGTWTRDVGAFRATLKVSPKQIVARINLDPTGRKDIREIVFTTEYTVSPDGKQLVGTITGADVRTSKRITYFEAGEVLKMARELDGRPIRFAFRVCDGVLSIRDVRVEEDAAKGEYELDSLAGIYTPETVKAVKPPAASKAGPVVEKPSASATIAPASAAPAERTGGKVEARGPVPVLPPLREGAMPDAPPSPCVYDVLKALPPAPRGVPFVFEVSRENLEQTVWIVKELEADKFDPPRFYPLVGIARLHHATWKCTVTFTETITSDFPFPVKTTHERVEVVRIPQMSLYRYVVPEAPAAPPVEPTKVSNGAGSVVPAGGTAPANLLYGTWVREQDGEQIVLTFTEKRLHVAVNAALAMPGGKGPPARITQSLDADYSTNPDGKVFGILTNVDITLGEGLPSEAYATVKEARRERTKVIGAMFTFRTRLDGGRMTLSEPRASRLDSVRGPAGDVKADEKALVDEIFGGRFERVTGKVPPPKPTDPSAQIGPLQKPEGGQRQKGTGLVPPVPKCKDCSPLLPLKLIPGGSEFVPPIPMSRS